MNRSARRSRRPDRGSVTVELVVLAPVMVALVLFIVFLGRAGGSVQQVRHAADAGARAASLVSRPLMESTAAAAASRDLASNGIDCASTSIGISVSGPPDAGWVTVTVSCEVSTEGLSLVGAGSRTVTASSTEVIDRYRSNT